MRIIETEADLSEGAAHLVSVEPRFAGALDVTGPLPLRRRPDGFGALLDAIVSQQLSVAAADAIMGRMQAAGLAEPAAIRRAGDADLARCGLSRQKIGFVRALADSGFDFSALRHLPDEEVVAELVRLRGIGRWTAEIYAMFSLGRADVFAAGDLALQESARLLFALEARPAERSLREMATPWGPWRAVAARLLWAYYRHAKGREGVT